MGKVKAKKAEKAAEGVVTMDQMNAFLSGAGQPSAKIRLPPLAEVTKTYNREMNNAMEVYLEKLGGKLESSDGVTSSDDLISAAKGMGLYKEVEEIKDEDGTVTGVMPGHITNVAQFMANVKEILNEAKVAMRKQFMALRKAVKRGDLTREADVHLKGFAPGQIMGVMNNFALFYNRLNEGRDGKKVLLGFGREFSRGIETLTKLGDRGHASVVLRWRGEKQTAQNLGIATLVPVKKENEFQKKRA